MEVYKNDVALLSILTLNEEEAEIAIAENGIMIDNMCYEFEVNKSCDNILDTVVVITDIYRV